MNGKDEQVYYIYVALANGEWSYWSKVTDSTIVSSLAGAREHYGPGHGVRVHTALVTSVEVPCVSTATFYVGYTL